jgi:hypothetical protein
VRPSTLPSSELYLELLPAITQGAVELLDSRRLVAQLAGLERRTRAGGKDLIAHYPGGHDDLAVAAAGACVAARDTESGFYFGVSRHFVYGPEAAGGGPAARPRAITSPDSLAGWLKDNEGR